MSQQLSQLFVQKNALWKGCLFTLAIALTQASVFFLATDIFAKVLTSADVESAGIMANVSRGVIAMLAFTGAFAAWMMAAVASAQNRHSRRFLAQLPASYLQIQRARYRGKLINLMLPLVLCMAVFIGAAAMREMALEVSKIALNLIIASLLGLAIFELPIFGPASGRFSKVAFFVLSLLPLFLIVVLDSMVLTAIGALCAAYLTYKNWGREAKPMFLAPWQLLDHQVVASADLGKGGGGRQTSGKAVLHRWLLRNTLLQKPMLFLCVLVMVSPTFYGSGYEYSGTGRGMLTLYFLGVLVFGAAAVSRKLVALPISKKKIFAYIALPSLIFLTIGVTANEILSLNGISTHIVRKQGESPIRFSFDSSLTLDKSTQQICVPPQLLAVNYKAQQATVIGVNGESYPAPELAVLWPGGPRLYNPYYVPEVTDYNLDGKNITFQLERALRDYYGDSPPASELNARFVTVHSNGQVYFQRNEFNLWQEQWASERQGEFEDQEAFLHHQVAYLMPARALGWVLIWAVTLMIVFSLRAPYRSRKRHIARSTAAVLIMLTYFLVELLGRAWYRGFINTDGFVQRSRMIASETLREMMPEHGMLAWLSVLAIFVLAYHLTYRAYRKTEWMTVLPTTGQAYTRYQKWLRL